MERNKKIIQTSVIGIASNLVLILFKMGVGLVAHSIAIILDAINNLGDVLSMVITIIGTKLASKAPDKKHPYGYGRIEYISSILISFIILAAGLISVRESVTKIVSPEPAEYTYVSLIIIAAAVVGKFLSGRYIKSVGEKINAQSLVASGSDAFFDSILSLVTLVSAIVTMVWGVSLEGVLGLAISVIIIRAGLQTLMEMLNHIIGLRADGDLTRSLREKVEAFPGVIGAYDLTLHNYGPMDMIGSIHIEVADTMTAPDIHKLTREIVTAVYREFGIVMTIGIYASNTTDEKAAKIKRQLAEILDGYPAILQMHGFYVESEEKRVFFDVVIDFEADAKQVQKQLLEQLKDACPEYEFQIIVDSDYSD